MVRKIGFILLGIFLLLSALALIAQSPWGTKKAAELLTKSLNQWGLQVHMEKIEGALPHEISLTHVTIETTSFSLSAEQLRFQLSLWRLFKRELYLSGVQGKGISWTEKKPLQQELSGEARKLPFSINISCFNLKQVAIPDYGTIDAKGSFRMRKKMRHAFLDATITQKETTLHAKVSLRRSGLVQMHLDLNTPVPEGELFLDLFAEGPLTSFMQKTGTIQGRFRGDFCPNTPSEWNQPLAFSSRFQKKGDFWTFSRIQAKNDLLQLSGKATFAPDGTIEASWQMPTFSIGAYTAFGITGHGRAVWKEATLNGSAMTRGELFSRPWSVETQFSWEKGSLPTFPSYTIQGPTTQITGNLSLAPFQGTSSVQIDQLQGLPIADLFGSLKAEVLWEGDAVQIDGTGFNLYWKDLFSDTATFHADLLHPWNELDGALSVDLERVQRNHLALDAVSFATVFGSENWPFHLFVQGEWKHPLTLDLDGFWRLQNQNLLIHLQDVFGSFFNYPVSLSSPVTFTSSPLKLTPLELHVADATLLADLDSQKAHLTLKQFPIDFLSLNPLDVSVTGKIDLDVAFDEKEGSLHAAIDHFDVLSFENPYPLDAKGTLEGSYKKDRFDVKGDFSAHGTPLLTFDASLPVHLELWSFQVFPSDPIQGHLALRGKIEDFLDFFNLGTHYVEGMSRCNLTLSHTLNAPHLEGSCVLENGLYQNYYTGTQLENLSARILASGSTVTLESLLAQDPEKEGTLSAKGTLSLDFSRRFPFHFDTFFTNFHCLQLNLVSAIANGNVQIIGDLDQATARGDVEVVRSKLTIPDKIPRTLPQLEVVYRNASKPITPLKPTQKKRYPFFLDLNVHAPNDIFISGRGLNSQWGGTFHLGGTYAALATKGQIDLIKGEFLFSSRNFKLTEGSLLFTGAEKEMPYLNLSGFTEAKGVTIIAYLRGPLNNPQLTLQSTPPLPLSSILSLLLFGQDLSEINSFQALQLVNSLASLAGEGPDVLEKTRKAIGVDRLRIITMPSNDEEEGETVAVQVGKYIAEGVIVTFSQGAEDNGPNVGIEVELKHGFSFQIETQQKQEQGKFSLKWGMNY